MMTIKKKRPSLREQVRDLKSNLAALQAEYRDHLERAKEDYRQQLAQHEADQAKISELYASIQDLSEGRPGSGVVVIK